MLRFYAKIGPLGPILILFLLWLTLFTLNRLALAIYFNDSVLQVNNYLLLFPVGSRTDVVILCQALALPILIALFLPSGVFRKLIWFLTAYFTAISLIFIFFEIASWPFLNQYGSRPNQMMFQYFTHPKEVLAMVWAQYSFLIIFTAIILLLFAKLIWQLSFRLFHNCAPWPYWKNIASLPPVILLTIIGARSGIGEANANPAIAAFSNNYLTNQLALNATYSLSYAIYSANNAALNAEDLYGKMNPDEAIQRVKRYMNTEENQFVTADLPTLHYQPGIAGVEKPRNVVIVIMEGLGADYTGILGGFDRTPNFDKLSAKGLLFTNIYSSGTRTSRGIEALVSGLSPTSKSSSVLKLDLAQHNFFTIASLLKQHGYKSSFIYGGEAHFDNMSSFLLGNGFDSIIDENDFESPRYVGTWGVSDEDIFEKANDVFRKYDTQTPFLSVILTLSNHEPFDFPEGRINQVNNELRNSHNSNLYADWALGRFIDAAKKEDYFSNTVFLITGDHPMLIRSDNLFPIAKYHIPALILTPDIPPRKIETLGSQIDLLSTLLPLTGVNTIHPMIGNNLLLENTVSRQISIYSESFAFRTGDNVVVFQPHKAANSYQIQTDGVLQTAADNPELIKDALAHVLISEFLYRNQQYRLPEQYALLLQEAQKSTSQTFTQNAQFHR